MCYIDGSIDQATSTCPMCKIFRPTGARCPHKMELCLNKNHHPRYGVVHLKNAEVQSFNGCGYCKWARINPPPNKSGHYNLGWPGCCRQPTPQDYAYISPADWPAISLVHRISIPPEIKEFLETVTLPSSKITNVNRWNQVQSPKGKNNHSVPKGLTNTTSHNLTGASVSKSRADSSSPQPTISLSPPMHSTVRTDFLGPAEQRIENIRTTPASLRKLTEAHNFTSSLSVHNFQRFYQLTVSGATSSSTIPSRITTISEFTINDSLKRDLSTATEDALLLSTVISASKSDSSSCGSGSSRQSSGTVTSDGGFTDYLSDESEAEIQRQAEARAALMELNRVEEQEFKAARQQLATIDLHPPKGWNINVASQRSPSI